VRIAELQNEHAAVVRDLGAKSTEVQDLTGKLAEATAAGTQTNGTPADAQQPRPYQAPAYLGNQYLGLAWVVPRNISKNPKTGRLTFEPVLILDPRVKEAFAAPVATAAQDQEPPNYTVYNYNHPWPWFVWTPLVQASTNKPPRFPPAPSPGLPPRSPPVNSPWLPVGVPGRSVSPMNQRLRQPGGDRLLNSVVAPGSVQVSQPQVSRTVFAQ
jgi:hypothetical protein